MGKAEKEKGGREGVEGKSACREIRWERQLSRAQT